MGVPYDRFTEAFLSKISEYDFINMKDYERNDLLSAFPVD